MPSDATSQRMNRLELLKAEVRADCELAQYVRALSAEAKRLWATRCQQRLDAGEPVPGLGWRALVDVRREFPPPDGWLGDGLPWRPRASTTANLPKPQESTHSIPEATPSASLDFSTWTQSVAPDGRTSWISPNPPSVPWWQFGTDFESLPQDWRTAIRQALRRGRRR